MAITVRTSERLGPVRPLHGVNLGPRDFYWGLDFTEEYREAGVPSVRLHDAPLQMGEVVDLHCIFPHPREDPDDPANYYFACTDDYLASIRESGAQIYFRLGESIEHQPTKRFVDPGEWTPTAMATVCANIVRHYNRGWADGHEWGIEYWEFWGEPEGAWMRPPEMRPLWTAGSDAFFGFYAAVAPAVKAADPSVKLGLAGFTDTFVREWLAADVDDGQSCDGWAGLLARCVAAGLPVDFVSWHSYAEDWTAIEAMAAGVRARLDAVGLSAAENHLTEWNYNPKVPVGEEKMSFMGARRSKDWRKFEAAAAVANGSAGAAFVFGTLARLQDSPVDLAHLYTGVSMPFGLFSGTGRPHTKYFGFAAFGQLARAGERMRVDIDEPESLSALAVAAGDECSLAIANLSEGPREVRVRREQSGWPTGLDARWLADGGWQDMAGISASDGDIVVPFPGAGVALLTWPAPA